MIQAVLTDIEGTTSSISFVHEVLFPYARKNIGQFIRDNAQKPEVAAQLEAVAGIAEQHLSLDEIIATLEQWIDEDKKITPLKAIQGMLWETGYHNGEITGHVYDDTVEALKKWKAAGIPVYVYSSGSVKAQHLIFGQSRAGNLLEYFAGHFDTEVGGKRESKSYKAIASALGLAAADIVFLSDILEELDAARDAGMQTVGFAREKMPLDKGEHTWVTGFSELPAYIFSKNSITEH